MVSTIRRRLAGEAGISLIEMLMAIVVMGVILTGLASTLIASMVSLHGDELRVRATQLANQVIEELQATPWDEVGFFEDDQGYAATFDGNETVTLGPTRDGEPGPLPTQTIDRDGIAYQVTTNIAWIADSGEDEARLKALDVHVAWEERGSPRSHAVAVMRAPTPDEVSVLEEPDEFMITAFSVNPRPVPLQPPDNTAGEIEVRLRTSLPADSVTKPTLQVIGSDGEVEATWSSFEEDEAAGAPSQTAWALTIPEAEGQFEPGAYQFVVTAASATDSDNATETVWFVYPSDEIMEIQDPTFDPAPFCRSNNQKKTHFPVTVTFEVHGASGADSAHLTFEGTAEEIDANYTVTTTDGAVFEAVVPSDTEIDKSQAHLVLHAYRTIDSQEATLAYAAAVESFNDPANCSGVDS